MQTTSCALGITLFMAGKSRTIRMEMMKMTANNSIKVNPL